MSLNHKICSASLCNLMSSLLLISTKVIVDDLRSNLSFNLGKKETWLMIISCESKCSYEKHEGFFCGCAWCTFQPFLSSDAPVVIYDFLLIIFANLFFSSYPQGSSLTARKWGGSRLRATSWIVGEYFVRFQCLLSSIIATPILNDKLVVSREKKKANWQGKNNFVYCPHRVVSSTWFNLCKRFSVFLLLFVVRV